MAGAEENKENKYIQRDLLQRFISRNNFPRKFEKKSLHQEKEEEIELSLGLSLNGRFGVDPKRASKIIRASSISSFMICPDKKDTKSCSLGAAYDTALMRTCSLPIETQEWRKRKELQSLRRLEAKRKRLVKLKNVRAVRGKVESSGGKCEENGNGEILNGEKSPPQFCSQGSIGSQGSGSSGVSDFESQPIREANRQTEERSPASVQSPNEQKVDKPVVAEAENPSPKAIAAGKEVNKTNYKKMMTEMPFVSTRVDNGKRIGGFLYRYRNGEEVRILCVCHGRFLSPAEFVEHAGGGEVDHPLRHIVINPSPLLQC